MLSNVQIPDIPCITKELHQPAKLRNGQNYIIHNTKTHDVYENVDILHGIELPGVDNSKYEFPPEHSKVIELVTRLKKIIKLDIPLRHIWANDFTWIIADKNSYKPSQLKIPALGKTYLYQITAICGNFVLRYNGQHAEIDRFGNCYNDEVFPIILFQQLILILLRNAVLFIRKYQK